MENKLKKKKRYFTPINININFTTNTEKLLWAETVWGVLTENLSGGP
jgi:hypothetical protein